MPTLPDYLNFKQGKLATLRGKLQEADAPTIPLTVTARVAGGSGVRPVQVRQFTIVTDSGDGLAGYDLGPTSPELLLSSLASCLAHTYLMIAVKHGITYESIEVRVDSDIDFRGVLEVEDAFGDEPPIPLFHIRYEAQINSSASDAQLDMVQRDVERLCPVLRTVVDPTPVTGKIVRVEE